MTEEKKNLNACGPTGPIGCVGPRGSIGVCPQCGGMNIHYNLREDRSLCMDCGFSDAWRVIKSGMSFGLAIEAMRNGHKARRRGWNGRNQYIELASAISYKTPNGKIVNAEHDAIGNQAIAFCGTSGVQMGWLASQADMLADDWELLE